MNTVQEYNKELALDIVRRHHHHHHHHIFFRPITELTDATQYKH